MNEVTNTKEKSINFLGFLAITACILSIIVYFMIRRPTTATLWNDIEAILPYLIAGGISFILGFLDLYEKFSDFGPNLPVTNKYGWIHLLFNTFTPMLLLYAYLFYFPTLGFPKIGDVWMSAFVVSLAFPLLIRSKFFSYTNSVGENVSVGFDQLYDRLVEFLTREILRSSKALEMRRNLVKRCTGLFTLQKL
jgi:hypothetical protein